MTVGYFKQALWEFLPNKVEYVLYLYDKFGKILYDDEWDTEKEFNTSNKKYWKDIYAILVVLERFSIEEQMDIIEFIFRLTEKKLYFDKKNK